jgi:integrase
MFYAFLHREGTRRSEAGAMTWSDFDLLRGVVVLGENKTNDPRAWALSPGVAEALHAWRELRARNGEDVGDDASVFVDEEGKPISGRMADQYREHLRAAGITRPVLFERSKSRQCVRLHDTRATFVTVSLANGKSEAWVQDRTGHKSSTMIAKYRRAARMAAEVGMGPFVRMDVAVGSARYLGEAEGAAVLH